MSEAKIRVGITHGDINGIGYEVIIKALTDSRMTDLCTPVIYGSQKALSYYKKITPEAEEFSFKSVASAAEADPNRVNLVSCGGEDITITPGQMKPEAGVAAVEALKKAAQELKEGLIDVIVTAPICKENVQMEGFDFTGHTEFFASEFNGTPLMLMCSEKLKVGLVTIHVPLAEVSSLITKDKIIAALKELRLSLIKDFSIHEPRIAVLSLNPHNGDGGLIGKEEIEIIKPAIQAAAKGNILAFGPFAADGFFASASYMKYDAVLAMYHDQGLAPFKAISEGGVNFTAGLSVVRTSPAHGVGFDIAGKGEANESSIRDAIYMAVDVAKSRRIYKVISANPLQRSKRETGGKDVSVFDLMGHHNND